MALDLAIFLFAVVGHNGNNGDNGMHGLVLSANPLDEWFCFQWQSLFSVIQYITCFCADGVCLLVCKVTKTFRTIRTKGTTIFERNAPTIYYI